ncbi:MAG: hypothetical protein COZ56_11550 [Armatimonadetes bacterium CG_4_8_14_3_um_filter_58_9]|nr:MAG: hypothetical protein COZ56_11550 [Armatimonadetes bacterium CG_4_8_14_3_um_filter_58_9]
MHIRTMSRSIQMGLIRVPAKRMVAIVIGTVALSLPALGQRKVTIIEPQPGAAVKEELTVTVAKAHPGEGYVIYKVDGVFREASSEVQYTLDTKELTDGEHTVLVEDHDGTGAIVGTAEVKFTVANKIAAADATTSAVPLFHWDYQQFLDKEITTYVLWAQGIAASAKKKAPAPVGGAGGGEQGQQGPDVIVLDRQLSLKIRQIIRDVSVDGTANVRTIVEGGHERWRHYEQAAMDPEEPPTFAGAGGWCFSGGGAGKKEGAGGPAGAAAPAAGAGGGEAMAMAEPVKVWDGEGSCELCEEHKESGLPPIWCPSAEVGRTYTKKIHKSGKEVNATRKYDVWPYEHGARFAMSELQPMFDDRPVRPGDQWQSAMTFVCELAERRGINATVPLKFLGFEWQGGRKTAKLQTEFDMPETQAKEVAMVCIDFVGAGQAPETGAEGGGAGGGLPSGAFQGTNKKKPPRFISPPRVHVKRVIYFDYARKKILRTEDNINSRFAFKPPKQAAGAMGGGMAQGGGMAGGGGGASQPAEPESWSYNVTIITQLDESPAEPTPIYNQRGISGRDYDHVKEKNDRTVPPDDPKRPQF